MCALNIDGSRILKFTHVSVYSPRDSNGLNETGQPQMTLKISKNTSANDHTIMHKVKLFC